MEVITSHISADFDALASMVAAQKLHPQARMYFSGAPDQSVREFMALHKDFIDISFLKDSDKENIRKLIIVDTRIPSRLGDFRDLVNNPQIEVHIYDHHPPTQEAVAGDHDVIEFLGATVTILIKKLREKNIPISPLEATILALGIYEETGSLTFMSTTRDDVDAVSFLLGCGANLRVVSSFVYHTLSEEQRKLLNQLLASSTVHFVHGFRILLASADAGKYVNELALLTHRMMDLERWDAIFSIVRMKERSYIVGRSRQDAIDVSAVLARFGGGGHPTAGSAAVKGDDVGLLEEELLEELQKRVKPYLVAADIMSSPVHTLDVDELRNFKEARDRMLFLGHSGLPVTKEGRLIGIISRRDIDKAVHHGYGSAPIKAYMNREVVTINRETPLAEIQRIMIEHDVGRLPVMEEDNIVGIVTRTDVLSTLHGELGLKDDGQETTAIPHLKSLPVFLQNVMSVCGEVGDQEGCQVYLVGGFVRDLILATENLDVDLVVEGDGIAYAEKIAGRLGGRVRSHEKFGTALVILDSGFKLDVASSRMEFYTRPAALPEVMMSSIKQDLYRRDFTINAMAVALNRRMYGQLIDFFGGQRDLRQKTIRVLHNLSFVEDPTRIFRAIRFEQRFEFRMDQHTESLLRNALYQNIFDRLTQERIKEEFILILNEARPLPAIKRMEQLKILRLIHPAIHLNRKMEELIEDITATLVQFDWLLKKEKIEQWIIYFLALISQLSLEQMEEIGRRYKVTTTQMKKLTLEREHCAGIVRDLSPKKVNPSFIYRLLEPLSLEAVLFLLARTNLRSVKAKIAQYLVKWRNFRPMVRGKDLKTWGYQDGPLFRKILDFLKAAQLDGLFETREEARLLTEKLFGSPENGTGD
jgi:tRNA nucleotidyltransferase (CCA-adding enzyme)